MAVGSGAAGKAMAITTFYINFISSIDDNVDEPYTTFDKTATMALPLFMSFRRACIIYNFCNIDYIV